MLSRSKQPDPAVLISLCGDDGSFDDLSRYLTQRGYESIVIAHSAFDGLSADDVSTLRSELNAAWVVHALQRPPAEVNREIDVASELLGSERVGLLVESSVPVEAERFGYNRIRFNRNRVDQVADQLVTELEQMGVAGQSGVRRRLEATQSSRFATGLAAPMMLLTLTITAAVLAGLYLMANGVLGDDSEAVGTDSVRGASPSSTESPPAGAAEGTSEADSDVFAPVDAAPPIDGAAAAQPSGPEQADPDASAFGDPSRLPDTCQLDLRRQAVIAETTQCSQGGILVLQGPAGPWHNDVGQIIISQGAVGSLAYEDVAGRVMLAEGIHQLDLERSAYGLESLQLTFTGEGQHIHFIQAASRGSAELTLTFRFGS